MLQWKSNDVKALLPNWIFWIPTILCTLWSVLWGIELYNNWHNAPVCTALCKEQGYYACDYKGLEISDLGMTIAPSICTCIDAYQKKPDINVRLP
jgi:hypothetical protein